MKHTITSILVANRGEIAVRVLRAARRCGYQTVAVYSEADADAVHVREADRAVWLGAAAAAESYLSIEKVIAAAITSGADAIHPGYGFLSERAEFARAVRSAGLIFLGPSAEAIEAMGDKSAAKERMLAAGVPCLPGFHGRGEEEQQVPRLAAEGRRVGFPLMVKAAAGGGGRGMRLVHDADKLEAALEGARAEALAAFGDGTLLVERALLGARHVEVQVFGDEHGQVVHLGERDCSVQRRNQKVVEEAPSPVVSPALRREMGAAAVRAAEAVGYVGAGTVEFMLDRDGAFYFLEMNTRLQVEHPVTELTYDVDLVEWQFRVAEGRALPMDQAALDARRRGHAIEVRLCAEDAEFRPQTGRVLAWRPPSGPGVRVDAALADGLEVGAHYDSMLGKLIAFGEDREQARQRLRGALEQSCLFGVVCNREVLLHVLCDPVFARGEATTRFFAEQRAPARALPAWHLAVAALVFELDEQHELRNRVSVELLGWQSAQLAARPRTLRAGEVAHKVRLSRGAGLQVQLETGTFSFADVEVVEGDLRALVFVYDGVRRRARYLRAGACLWLELEGVTHVVEERSQAAPERSDATNAKSLVAKMVGKVVRVPVEAGAEVTAGQVLVVVESMKMEFELALPTAGVARAVHVRVGDQVRAGQTLVELA